MGLGRVVPAPRRASASARRMKRWSASSKAGGIAAAAAAFRRSLARSPARLHQRLQLIHQLRNVTERSINRGESHIRNDVYVSQRRHHRVADARGRNNQLTGLLQVALDE